MPDEAPAATTTTAPAVTTTAPAATTTAPAPSASFDWTTAGLSPEHLSLVQDRGWKNPGDITTSYRNLEKLTGVPPERMVKIPGPKDDPKMWDEVYGKLGRPETADKYVIPVPKGDKGEFAGVAKNWFHEAGISQSQATKLSTAWNAHVAAQAEAAATQTEQRNQTEVTALKQAWGGEFDAKSALVEKAATEFGMTEAHLNNLKNAMGPKAAMEFMHNLGAKLGTEDAIVPGINNGTNPIGRMTPAQAQVKLAELRNDPTFAKLYSSPDPKQKMEARAQIDQLSKIAYPGMTPVKGA